MVFARKYLKYIFKPKNKISRLRGLNPFSFKGYHVILSWSLNFWRAQSSMILLPAKIIFLSCDGNMKIFIMATFLLLDN